MPTYNINEMLFHVYEKNTEGQTRVLNCCLTVDELETKLENKEIDISKVEIECLPADPGACEDASY
tara:strand:- start:39058 stop:39255 length:198 start_codon:yes stop_codon:yes gene_type:complete